MHTIIVKFLIPFTKLRSTCCIISNFP